MPSRHTFEPQAMTMARCCSSVRPALSNKKQAMRSELNPPSRSVRSCHFFCLFRRSCTRLLPTCHSWASQASAEALARGTTAQLSTTLKPSPLRRWPQGSRSLPNPLRNAPQGAIRCRPACMRSGTPILRGHVLPVVHCACIALHVNILSPEILAWGCHRVVQVSSKHVRALGHSARTRRSPIFIVEGHVLATVAALSPLPYPLEGFLPVAALALAPAGLPRLGRSGSPTQWPMRPQASHRAGSFFS